MSSLSKPILILHGPNLDLLGTREPEIYGPQTLDDINTSLSQQAETFGVTLRFFQSNHEGYIIDTLHQAIHDTAGLIINPGGLTHTSVVLRDALASYPHPAIEVHLSNIYRREPFRHQSLISGVVSGCICGLGAQGYTMALSALFSLCEGFKS